MRSCVRTVYLRPKKSNQNQQEIHTRISKNSKHIYVEKSKKKKSKKFRKLKHVSLSPKQVFSLSLPPINPSPQIVFLPRPLVSIKSNTLIQVSRQVTPWQVPVRQVPWPGTSLVWHLSALAVVCLALVWSGSCQSGTCLPWHIAWHLSPWHLSPGTCPVTETSNYAVWHLSPWHFSKGHTDTPQLNNVSQ